MLALVPPATYRLCLVAATVLFGTVLVLWAVLTPAFRAPDEPQHFNSVIRLVEGGGWPAPGEALISDGVRVAAEEAGWVPTQAPFIRQSGSVLPGEVGRTGPQQFVAIQPTDPADRSVITAVGPLDPATTPPAVDQMTQHPPGYYALGALLLTALDGEDWRWDQQLLALRLLSASLVVWLVPLAAAVTRNVGGSRRAALIAAVALTGASQLAHIDSAVTNDALANLAAAAVLWVASLAMTRRHTWRLAVGAGVVLGAGLLSKGFLLAAIPVVALAFILGRRANPRAAPRWWAAFWSQAVAFCVGGWWWLRNIVLYGAVQPDGMPPRPYLDSGREPDIGAFVRGAWDGLTSSGWGSYGWLELTVPGWFGEAATVVLLLAVTVALLAARGNRAVLAVLLLLPLLTLGIIIVGTLQTYVEDGYLAGLQGRYLFVGAAAFAACIGIATDTTAARLRAGAALPLAVPVVCLALGAAGLLFAFRGFYQPAGQPALTALERWEAWSVLSSSGITVTLLLPCVAGLVTMVLLAWAFTRAAPRDAAHVRRVRR